MKTKTKQFNQNLHHEDIEDEAKAESYLEESLPLVGSVVMYFNSLEQSIDSWLCGFISDRSDEPGFIVIQKLMFAAKVDLFKRFCQNWNDEISFPKEKFDELISELNEVAKLRNVVVHADWSSMDSEGYTFVRLKSVQNGFLQEYAQLSVESLEKLIERIFSTSVLLEGYYEWREDAHEKMRVDAHLRMQKSA